MYLFQRLRERFNASLGALDQLGIGALLVDGRSQIVHANGTARAILQAADGLYRDAGGRLAARDDDTNRALFAACQSAFATAVGEDIKEQSVMTAKRRAEGSDFLVTVSAVSDPLAELQPDFRSALVFIVDPNDRDRLSSSGIKALGLLTPAEMAVADLLVHGASTGEISERREVSEDTVRRQVKSILAKLNCRSRADVIRLAVATRLPMKEGEPLRPIAQTPPAGPGQ